MHWVALSRYVPALNESTNHQVSSPTGEPNPKDRPNRWENPSSLSTSPHSCVELMWDRITCTHKNHMNRSIYIEHFTQKLPYHIRTGDHRYRHLHLKKILSAQLLRLVESFRQEQTPQATVLPLLGPWRAIQ